MLSPIIKKLIEAELNKEIRYPHDIEHLSYDIERKTNQRISVNTLKRILGLIEGVKEPRLFTLDIIAHYLDFKNWDELVLHLGNDGNSEFNSIEEIELRNLQTRDKITFGYAPDREVTIEFVEKNTFIVTQSENSKLKEGDSIEIEHFVLHYPLLISKVVRNDINLGRFTAGKVSGITSLKLLK